MATYSFNPTSVSTAGDSYNTEDWLSLLTGLGTGGIAGAGSAAGINEQIARLRALGTAGVSDYANIAQQAVQGTEFTPYALTSGLGTVKQTGAGQFGMTLSPAQQATVDAALRQQQGMYGAAVPNTAALQTGAFSGAQGLLAPTGSQQIRDLSGMLGGISRTAAGGYGAATGLEGTTQQALTGAATGLAGVGGGMADLAGLRAQYGTAAADAAANLGGSTQQMADTLFQTQQAMVTPEQQRQALALENRLRAQGRLGTTTAAYGGTPEQLAMAKAIEEQRAGSAYGALTNAEQMAASQQARALGLGQATAGMAQNISGLTSEQQQRALGLLSAGQQGTQLQDQLLSSQLGRTTQSAQAASALQAADQALKQGDIGMAASLFNIGQQAAQLPVSIQGQQVAQAGQLQQQALAPSAQQLQQAQLAAQLGQQTAAANLGAGQLFGNIASAGVQERLTAESAAAALRGKQYASLLDSLKTQGNSGGVVNALGDLAAKGIRKIGGKLVDAAGNVIGDAVEMLGEAAADAWDWLVGTDDTNFDFATNPDLAPLLDYVSDSPSAIEEGWNWLKDKILG